MANPTDIETHETVQSPGASLADQLYAHREQILSPEPEAPATPEAELSEQDEPKAEEKDDAESLQSQGEEEQSEEGQEEDAHEEAQGDEEEIEVTTLEQLAEHLETDPDWIRGLKVTEKVNGKEVEVSLADALRTHRQVAAGDDYLADAKTKARTMLETASQEKDTLAAATVTIAALLQQAETAAMGGMSEQEMNQLRRDDPAEWAAKQKEFEDRRAQINQMKQQAGQMFSETEKKLKEQAKAKRDAELPAQRERLLELVPEWSDPAVAQKEAPEVNQFLTELGVEPEQIETIVYNGTFLAIARDAMLHKRSKGKIAAAKKKVVKIPKIMKPGKAPEDSKPKGGGDDPVSILYG